MKQLLFLHLLTIPLFVYAQQGRTASGTIKGIVLTSDGQPAQYVSITIRNTNEGATTDETGNFELKKIRVATHILDISLLGYFDTSVTVEVLQSETASLRIQLKRSYAELRAVIVAARTRGYVETKSSESLRMNLPLNEIPQNIAVTMHQLLSDQGAVSMTEALRTVSGVQKTGGALNDYSLMMRGTDVGWWALYRNGIGYYWWNQQEDVAMIEKIEFVKGPADFMVGASNGAGVTNIVTKQPIKERVASINAGYGSFNLMRLTADFGGSLNKSGRISYRFNAGIHNQERAFQFGKALHYFICPVLKYDINAKTSVTAEYNYMWGKTSGNNDNLPSLNGKMFALPRNFAVADDKSDQLTVADNCYRVNLKHNFNSTWHLNAQFAYVNGKWGGRFLETEDDLPVSGDTLYRYASYDDYRNFSKVAFGFVDGKFCTGKKIEHKVLFGPSVSQWGNTDIYGDTWGQQKFGLYIPRPDYYVNPDSLRNYPIGDSSKLRLNEATFYAQDNLKIAGKLIITLAGRFTHATISLWGYNVPKYQEQTRYDVFTPRGGLTWLFNDRLSAYAVYDQFFNNQFGPNYQNEPFKPMTGYNLETGAKGLFFNRKLGLNSSAFHIVRNNLVTADPLHQGFYIQKGQVVSNGIDFDLTGNLTSAIVINANYEYVDAKTTKDTDSSSVGLANFATPNHSANLWLRYNWQKGRFKGLSFAAGYQFIGKRTAVWYYNPDPATSFLPAHNLFDASIGYTIERFTLNLNVYNITNINYAANGYYSPAGEWRYTPGEPINFRLSVGINLLPNKQKLRSNG
jgi:iron complex outermembrane recepter protein